MEKYAIVILSSDECGEDSSWCADIIEQLFDTKEQAKEKVKEEVLKELQYRNENTDIDVIYYSDAKTLDVNVEDFDDEVEIWREEDNGRGIYLPRYMATRYSIKKVVM